MCAGSRFGLRWFTPVAEIKLCGHATLASAHVLFNILGESASASGAASLRCGLRKHSFPNDIILHTYNVSHEQVLVSPC